MPRRAKGPRLHLRPARADRAPVWVILDRGKESSTGCSEGDVEGAEGALAQYLIDKYEPPKTNGRLSKTLIADVVNVYLKERAPKTADKGAWVGFMCAPLLDYWGNKSLADVRAAACDAYVTWRTALNVGDQTARHELSILRAAINFYHANHGPLDAVPVVTLPPKASRRLDYWLTRKQVADRIRQARRKDKRWKHIARVLLIGVYTGTRPGAIRMARWVPSTSGGWFDLESETFHRRPVGKAETNKKQPAARIHSRLLPHLRRWKRLDEAKGISYVAHYYGKPIKKLRNAWASVAIAAGHATWDDDAEDWIIPDGPHICRHTAATWQMQGGTDPYEAAGYLGMSVETLLEVYGHHHPSFQTRAANATGKRAAPTKRPSNA
jgi:integrase